MLKQKPTIETHLVPVLETVFDPEIPVLSVLDLGVIREAKEENNKVYIQLCPTYSGCPAMDVISDDLKVAFNKVGKKVEVKLVLSPAWTTNWISKKGKEKMKSYGIAPPLKASADKAALFDGKKIISCPQCKSTNTQMLSQFGSTACKALYKCNDCLEPFDYFKCI
ncbi:MAG: 1,2-phenylacetyl-CoA epoxidase subunit PaaD [Flavobacteriales bacterium]